MSLRESRLYLPFALTLLTLTPALRAQPASVTDAQIPVVSTDGFNTPHGLAVAPGGIVYIADSGNQRVLKIPPAGVQTIVSFGAGVTPSGITVISDTKTT